MPRISVGIRIKPQPVDLICDSNIFNFENIAPDALSQEGLRGNAARVEITAGSKNEFYFDVVFDDQTTQDQIFDYYGKELVQNLLDGYNGTLFAYGQTGAGKTHTIFGPDNDNYDERGLCMRVSSYIFQRVRKIRDYNIVVKYSAIEIYNNNLTDLLRAAPSSVSEQQKLVIVDTPAGTLIPGLHVIPVENEEDAYNLIVETNVNRAVAEHQLNRRSSRSHLIYTFYITKTKTILDGVTVSSSDADVYQSKLNLVDLAGSERIKKTGSTGEVAKEAVHINKSLTYLEQVVLALTKQGSQKKDNDRLVVPYRQSKLTFMLKDSLGGNCNTYLIACVWPHKDHIWETLSTLRFASRMRCVENHPTRNSLVGDVSAASSASMRLLQQKIEGLKKELAIRDSILATRSTPSHYLENSSEPTKNQKMRLNLAIKNFILEDASKDSQCDIPIRTFTQLQYVLHSMKQLLTHVCGTKDLDLEEIVNTQLLNAAAVGPSGREDSMMSPRRPIAPADSIESTTYYNSNDTNVSSKTAETNVVANKTTAISEQSEEVTSNEEVDEAIIMESFRIFQMTSGSSLHLNHEEIKSNLKLAKGRLKYLVSYVNKKKLNIDEISEDLKKLELKQSREITEQIQEEQENKDLSSPKHQATEEPSESPKDALLEQLRQAKVEYKSAKEELLKCKEQIEEMTRLKQKAFNTLIKAFKDYSEQNQSNIEQVGKVDDH